MRVKPNFFILGAPKCGTTSVAAWLKQHPAIFIAATKESNFASSLIGVGSNGRAYALQIRVGALDAMLQRAKPSFDNEVTAILARLSRSWIVCSDKTSARIEDRTHWNWVFQHDKVVIHVLRNSRAANVVTETMGGHRPSIWVSDLYGAQQGHADL